MENSLQFLCLSIVESRQTGFYTRGKTFPCSLDLSRRAHSILRTSSGQMHYLDVPNLPFRGLFFLKKEKQQKEPTKLISFV